MMDRNKAPKSVRTGTPEATPRTSWWSRVRDLGRVLAAATRRLREVALGSVEPCSSTNGGVGQRLLRTPLSLQPLEARIMLSATDVWAEIAAQGVFAGGIEFEPDGTLHVSADLADSAEVDFYRFYVPEGDADCYQVHVDIDARDLGSNIAPVIEVLDGSGNWQRSAFDPAGAADPATFLDFDAGERGFISVRHDPNLAGTFPGDYDLSATLVPLAEEEPNDTRAAATHLDMHPGTPHSTGGAEVMAAIDAADDVDVYSVDVPAGHTLTVEVLAEEYGSDLNPTVAFYDGGGSLLGENHDFHDPVDDELCQDPYLTLDAASDQTVYIQVSSENDEAGPYELVVTAIPTSDPGTSPFEPDDVSADATDLGAQGRGLEIDYRLPDIGSATDIDFYSFDAQAGDFVEFEIWTDVLAPAPGPDLAMGTPDDGTTAIESGLDPVFMLYDASGTEVEPSYLWESDIDMEAGYSIPSTGTYYIGVAAWPNVPSPGGVDPAGRGATVGYYEIEIEYAPLDFVEHFLPESGGTGEALYPADIDGDGDLDLVGAAEDTDQLAWWENDGDGLFTTHPITASLGAAGLDALYAIDLDGDSDVDLIGGHEDGASVVWWENDGAQTFTEHLVGTSLDSADDVSVADLDGDTLPDIVAGTRNWDDLAWWRNNGDGTFSDMTIDGSYGWPERMATHDVDSDGDQDVVAAVMQESTLVWYQNDGTGAFTERTITNDFPGASAVVPVDLDGDSDVDLLAGAAWDGLIAWWENDGAESFTQHPVAERIWSVVGVDAGDLDGDGDLDLVAAAWNRVLWWENDGTQDFTSRFVGRAERGTGIYAVDLSGDGQLDVLSGIEHGTLKWFENLGGPIPDAHESAASPNDSIATATPIPPVLANDWMLELSDVLGEITAPDDVDFYQVQGEAGHTLVFEIETDGWSSGDQPLVPSVSLYDEVGTSRSFTVEDLQWAEHWDEACFYGAFDLTEAAPVYIAIGSQNGAVGRYELSVECNTMIVPTAGGGGDDTNEPNDDFASAMQISLGEPPFPTLAAGEIGSSTDVDFFEFSAEAGAIVELSTVAERLGTDPTADTMLTLYDSAGNVIAINDDDEGSFVTEADTEDSLLWVRLPATDTYYLGVSSWDSVGDASGVFDGRGATIGKYLVSLVETTAIPPLRVTSAPEQESEPDWSPDGSSLVFASGADGDFDVYTIAVDGTGLTQITSDAAPELPGTWSPDGSQVVFGSGGAIWGIDADGTDPWQIVDEGLEPAWSPDGGRIAFNRWGGIYTVDVDGANLTLLTGDSAFDDAYCSHPAWSPDGSQLAFTGQLDGYNAIWLMNADGTDAHELVASSWTGEADWSPDGQWIAFETPDQRRIDAICTDGTGHHTLVEHPWYTASDPSWSPDGTRLAFSGNVDGNTDLWIIALSDPSEPNDDFDAATPVDLPFDLTPDFNSGDDIDFYTFTLADPAVVSIWASDHDGSGVTCHVGLFDGEQALIREDTGGGADLSMVLVAELDVGSYYLAVDSADAGTGMYVLSGVIIDDSDIEPANNDLAGAVPFELWSDEGDPDSLSGGYSALIEPVDDVDWFSIHIPADREGMLLTVSANADWLGSTLDSVLGLYDEYGSLLTENGDRDPDTSDASVRYAVTEGTTYYVRVSGENDTAGYYDLCASLRPMGVTEVYLERGIDYESPSALDDEYEFGIEILGRGITGIELTTPWYQTIDLADWLPPDWSGYGSIWAQRAGLEFEARQLDTETRFSFCWEGLSDGQWEALTWDSTRISVTYVGGVWEDWLNFTGVPQHDREPNPTSPVHRAVELSDVTPTWPAWDSAPENGGILVALTDAMSDGQGFWYEEDLPASATSWPLDPLALGLYQLEIEFSNEVGSVRQGAWVSRASFTENDIYFVVGEPGATLRTHPDTDHVYFLTPPAPWHEAEALANQFGGHLVTLNDADEEAWVKQEYGIDEEYWLGFSDIDEEGVWVWSSGEPVTYTNWAEHEPNDEGGDGGPEDAAVMNYEYSDGDRNEWNDLPADLYQRGVVELPAGSTPDLPDDHGNTYDEATPIATPTTLGGALSYPGDIDFFSFGATEGQTYDILVELPDGGLEDSSAWLYDTDGHTVLARDDEGGHSGGSRIVWTAPTDGTYYLAIDAYEIYDRLGAYTIQVDHSDISFDTPDANWDLAAEWLVSDREGLTAVSWKYAGATSGEGEEILHCCVDLGRPRDFWVVDSYALGDTEGVSLGPGGSRIYLVDDGPAWGSLGQSEIVALDTSSWRAEEVYRVPTQHLDVECATVLGDHLYACTRPGEGSSVAYLEIYDISDPSTAVFVGESAPLTSPIGDDLELDQILVDDGLAYVLHEGSIVLSILDVSDPTAPGLLSQHVVSAEEGLWPWGVAFHGDTLWTGVDWALQGIDVSDPTSPTLLAELPMAGKVGDIDVDGDLAYVGCVGIGVRVVDLSDPADPQIVDTYHVAGATGGVAAKYGHVFVPTGTGPTAIFQYDHTPPTVVDASPAPGSVVPELNEITVTYSEEVTGPSQEQLAHMYTLEASGGDGTFDDGNEVLIAGHTTYDRDTHVATFVPGEVYPIEIGSHDEAWGALHEISVLGDYAYVADETGELHVVDVSDPGSMAEVAVFRTAGSAFDVDAVGGYAYVATCDAGLTILDISDPLAPLEVARLDTRGGVFAVDVEDGYAYVADSIDGLLVIDVGDPTAPALVGSYSSPLQNVRVADNHAYLWASQLGEEIHIVDVTQPTSPTFLRAVTTDFGPSDLAIAGSYAYAIGYDDASPHDTARLGVLDVSNPAQATQVASHVVEGSPHRISASGNHLLITGSSSLDGYLQIYDISDPLDVTRVAVTEHDDYGGGLVQVLGSTAYLGAMPRGVVVLDVSSPESPTLLGSYVAPPGAVDIAVMDGYAYVTSDDWSESPSGGLQILDVSDPSQPVEVARVAEVGYAGHVAVSGDYVYLYDEGDGSLRVVDVADPLAPEAVGWLALSGWYGSLVVDGATVYLGGDDGSVHVVDVSDPAAPFEASSFALAGGSVSALGILDDYLYASTETSGLQVLDVSDPMNPLVQGSADGSDQAVGIHLHDSHAYVASYDRTWIYDVSDPSAPTPVAHWTYALDVHVSGDYAILSKHGMGEILNISDPTHPVQVCTFRIGGGTCIFGDAAKVDRAGDILYVAARTGGVRTFELAAGLPSDTYRLMARSGVAHDDVHDLAGNALDGEYPGSPSDFPTGDGSAGGDFEATFQLAGLPEIHGTKWNDLDGDGVRGDGEPGLEGWTIYLDLNANGQLDTELLTLDSSDVPTTIEDLATATSELVVSGVSGSIADVNVWLDVTHTYVSDLSVSLTSPAGTTVELLSDLDDSGPVVANLTETDLDDEAETSILDGSAPFTGFFSPVGLLASFDGEDANGTWTLDVLDSGEGDTGTLNDWGLVLTIGDLATETDVDGAYSFTNLQPDTYTVAEVLMEGWEQTYPAPGQHVVGVGPSQVVGDVDFGNQWQLGEISGGKWEDLDGDGVWDDDEPGVEDWTIYLDLDSNGLLDTELLDLDSSDIPKVIEDLATATSELVVMGVSGSTADVNVWLDVTHTYVSDLSVFLTSPEGTRVELLSDLDDSGPLPEDLTDTELDDEADTSILDGSAPFTGSFLPVGLLASFDGEDANGTWTLEVLDSAEEDTGTLNGWGITLTIGDLATETDVDGTYSFTSLWPDTYTVAEALERGWQQTYPTAGQHVVGVGPSQVVEDIDFGNLAPSPPGLNKVLMWRTQNYEYPGPQDDSLDYGLEVYGSVLTRMQVTTPWGEPFDSAQYVGDVWDGDYFWEETGDLQVWFHNNGDQDVMGVWWDPIASVEWDALATGSSTLTVTYDGGSWTGVADFTGSTVPAETPNITYAAHLERDVPVQPTFEWDQWASPGGNAVVWLNLVESAADNWPYSSELPADATSWAPPEPLGLGTAYDFEVDFGNLAPSEVNGVSVEAGSYTASHVLFNTTFTFPLVEYTVYGSNSFDPSGDWDWWWLNDDPGDLGFEWIGTGSGTDTFPGAYDFYFVQGIDRPAPSAIIDAIVGSDDAPFALDETFRVAYPELAAVEDGEGAVLGAGEPGGGFLLDAQARGLTSITVIVPELPQSDILTFVFDQEGNDTIDGALPLVSNNLDGGVLGWLDGQADVDHYGFLAESGDSVNIFALPAYQPYRIGDIQFLNDGRLLLNCERELSDHADLLALDPATGDLEVLLWARDFVDAGIGREEWVAQMPDGTLRFVNSGPILDYDAGTFEIVWTELQQELQFGDLVVDEAFEVAADGRVFGDCWGFDDQVYITRIMPDGTIDTAVPAGALAAAGVGEDDEVKGIFFDEDTEDLYLIVGPWETWPHPDRILRVDGTTGDIAPYLTQVQLGAEFGGRTIDLRASVMDQEGNLYLYPNTNAGDDWESVNQVFKFDGSAFSVWVTHAQLADEGLFEGVFGHIQRLAISQTGDIFAQKRHWQGSAEIALLGNAITGPSPQLILGESDWHGFSALSGAMLDVTLLDGGGSEVLPVAPGLFDIPSTGDYFLRIEADPSASFGGTVEYRVLMTGLPEQPPETTGLMFTEHFLYGYGPELDALAPVATAAPGEVGLYLGGQQAVWSFHSNWSGPGEGVFGVSLPDLTVDSGFRMDDWPDGVAVVPAADPADRIVFAGEDTISAHDPIDGAEIASFEGDDLDTWSGGMAAAADGTLYVVQFQVGVNHYGADGTLLLQFQHPDLQFPGSVALSSDGLILYVSDFVDNDVFTFNTSDASVVDPGEPSFVVPTVEVLSSIAVDDAGVLYATDEVTNRVVRYDRSTSGLTELPLPGISAHSVVVLPDDRVAAMTDYVNAPWIMDVANLLGASLGSHVWLDVDEDGVQDGSELGLANVTVELFDVGADGQIGGGDDVSHGTQTTGIDGSYSFTDVMPGTYYLEFRDLPSGHRFTAADQGGDDSVDSDVAPATGLTGTIPFDGLSDDLTADAGAVTGGGVAGRHIFYNQSYFDGNDPAAGISDDDAIATDKSALLPGSDATFANYTSYSRGINGIMVDIDGLADPTGLTAASFGFRVGNTTDPSAWPTGPAPTTVAVREGDGMSGSDRVTLIWANNAIEKEWLQVTVLADATTGLTAPDVFYFGNAIGESGNSSTNTYVDGTDFAVARDNFHSFLNRASVDYAYDYNRDSFVDGTDMAVARDNNTNFLTALKLLGASQTQGASMQMASQGETVVGDVAAARGTIVAPQPETAAQADDAAAAAPVAAEATPTAEAQSSPAAQPSDAAPLAASYGGESTVVEPSAPVAASETPPADVPAAATPGLDPTIAPAALASQNAGATDTNAVAHIPVELVASDVAMVADEGQAFTLVVDRSASNGPTGASSASEASACELVLTNGRQEYVTPLGEDEYRVFVGPLVDRTRSREMGV